jgi:hypothetical protein
MRRWRTLLQFLAAAAVFAAVFAASAHPSRLPYAIAAIGTVAIATSGVLSFLALNRRAAITPALMPGLLVGSASFAIFFIESAVLRLFLAGAASLLFFILIRHLAESTKIEGASAAVRALFEWSALIVVVSLTAALMASATFLNWNQWLTALVFAAAAVFSAFTLARLGQVRSKLLPAIASILLVEAYVLLLFLPVSHWVSAGVVAALAYLFFSLVSNVPAASMRRALVSAGAICLLLLGTARWR